MIKQLFKAKAIATLVMAAFVLIAVSGFNEVKAQQQSATSLSQEIQANELDPAELAEFKSDLLSLIEDANTNPIYGNAEKSIRLELYDNVRRNVLGGLSIEQSVDAAVPVTKVYAQEEYPGHQVNIKQLATETKTRLL